MFIAPTRNRLCVGLLLAAVVLVSIGSSPAFALAPPTGKDGNNARPQKMVRQLKARVARLRSEGKSGQADKVIKQAQQRVQDSKAQYTEKAQLIHEAVEKLGSGKEVDLDEITHFKKELSGLKKTTQRLIKSGKKKEAESRADRMHQWIREQQQNEQKRFDRLENALTQLAKSTEGERKSDHAAHSQGASKHMAESHHATDAHASNDLAAKTRPATGDEEVDLLYEEIDELRIELNEIRDLVKALRDKTAE